ncbi:hypothetical protein C7446_2591 [Kushneria sinocarnis]|uniref:DUF1853 family protein n=1 Tax=Kushneria sinocarnis TaxID=595502 RepID=A0A420WUP7_9GAMM|nr:DUF1853 family protein [Kushneria sinocarnis]RKQ97171.1 hypothetical protein C7446_2591 [Kushneria sinocarnis]
MNTETHSHPLLRDLAWLIDTPPLLESRLPGAPARAALGLEDRQQRHRWFEALAQDLADLEQHVGAEPSLRLGIYVERLWQIILARAPATRLLAHNLPITRNRRTLGELDLLYEDRERAAPIHLEVAIKFYLGLPEGPGTATAQSRWIGTGGPDSLARKHLHLLTHQTRLGRTAEARDALSEFGAPPLRCRMALQGALFYPWQRRTGRIDDATRLPELTGMPAPAGAHPAHPAGVWLRWRDWPHFVTTLQLTGVAQLWRPHWLALPGPDELLFPESLLPELRQAHARHALPLQLVVGSDRLAPLRVMLVPDEWPLQIPLPPRRTPGSRRRGLPLAPWPR